jgi:hypothetical protein
MCFSRTGAQVSFSILRQGANLGTVATEKNQIWSLSILIFNWSPLFADFSYFSFAFKLFFKDLFVQITPKFAQLFFKI